MSFKAHENDLSDREVPCVVFADDRGGAFMEQSGRNQWQPVAGDLTRENG